MDISNKYVGWIIRLLSNVGDYAWGRDGLDAVVTQLMNQMEGTGPPPLATDRIDTLPDVTINQDQVGESFNVTNYFYSLSH